MSNLPKWALYVLGALVVLGLMYSSYLIGGKRLGPGGMNGELSPTSDMPQGNVEAQDTSTATTTPTTTPKTTQTKPTTKPVVTQPKPAVNTAQNIPTNVNIDLYSKVGSVITGRATFASTPDGKTKVTLALVGAPAITIPAQIRMGRCSAPGTTKYLLTSAVSGGSSTMLPVSMATLRTQLPLSVVVQSSTQIAACGDISI